MCYYHYFNCSNTPDKTWKANGVDGMLAQLYNNYTSMFGELYYNTYIKVLAKLLPTFPVWSTYVTKNYQRNVRCVAIDSWCSHWTLTNAFWLYARPLSIELTGPEIASLQKVTRTAAEGGCITIVPSTVGFITILWCREYTACDNCRGAATYKNQTEYCPWAHCLYYGYLSNVK